MSGVDVDPVLTAARAARDVGRASRSSAAVTRARIEAELFTRHRARRASRRVGWLMAAAALATATAWAAGHSVLRLGTPEGVTGSANERSAPAVRAVDAPHTAALLAETARQAEVQGAHEPPAEATIAPRASPPPPVRAVPRASPPPIDVDAVYRAAHDAHFRRRDAAAALAAWDRYLAVAPSDPHAGFVLEARYNRAICMLRLGRDDEAREALRPFAEGAYGEYRRAEARALLAR